jgi:hypothetical protein
MPLVTRSIILLSKAVLISAITLTPALLVAQPLVPIADIHANLQQYKGQQVTIQGQVYIPTNYRSPATTYSGYIQDSSERGINLFGSTTNNPLLQDIGNIVQVTGTVDTFFTTVEVVNLTSIQLVSGGNPPLQPRALSTSAAASHGWEGTFIQSGGRITQVATTGGGSPAHNYTVNDGTGPLVIRIIDSLGLPTFAVDDTISARGAGSQFNTDFQILVGRAADVWTGLVGVMPTSWAAIKRLYLPGAAH